jgi:hypothetical protein
MRCRWASRQPCGASAECSIAMPAAIPSMEPMVQELHSSRAAHVERSWASALPVGRFRNGSGVCFPAFKKRTLAGISVEGGCKRDRPAIGGIFGVYGQCPRAGLIAGIVTIHQAGGSALIERSMLRVMSCRFARSPNLLGVSMFSAKNTGPVGHSTQPTHQPIFPLHPVFARSIHSLPASLTITSLTRRWCSTRNGSSLR